MYFNIVFDPCNAQRSVPYLTTFKFMTKFNAHCSLKCVKSMHVK